MDWLQAFLPLSAALITAVAALVGVKWSIASSWKREHTLWRRERIIQSWTSVRRSLFDIHTGARSYVDIANHHLENSATLPDLIASLTSIDFYDQNEVHVRLDGAVSELRIIATEATAARASELNNATAKLLRARARIDSWIADTSETFEELMSAPADLKPHLQVKIPSRKESYQQLGNMISELERCEDNIYVCSNALFKCIRRELSNQDDNSFDH